MKDQKPDTFRVLNDIFIMSNDTLESNKTHQRDNASPHIDIEFQDKVVG